MTQAELLEVLWKAVGLPPPIAAREALSRGSTSLRYEWIKDWKELNRLIEAGTVELSDGEEWVTLTLPLP